MKQRLTLILSLLFPDFFTPISFFGRTSYSRTSQLSANPVVGQGSFFDLKTSHGGNIVSGYVGLISIVRLSIIEAWSKVKLAYALSSLSNDFVDLCALSGCNQNGSYRNLVIRNKK